MSLPANFTHVLATRYPCFTHVLQVDGVRLNEALSACEKGSAWSFVVALRRGRDQLWMSVTPYNMDVMLSHLIYIYILMYMHINMYCITIGISGWGL